MGGQVKCLLECPYFRVSCGEAAHRHFFQLQTSYSGTLQPGLLLTLIATEVCSYVDTSQQALMTLQKESCLQGFQFQRVLIER